MLGIASETNDIDSSVMIDGVKEFHSTNLHGVMAKMNHDGVDMVHIVHAYVRLCLPACV